MSIKGIGKRIGDMAYRFATVGCGCDGSCQGCQGHCAGESVSAHEKERGKEANKSCVVEKVKSEPSPFSSQPFVVLLRAGS